MAQTTAQPVMADWLDKLARHRALFVPIGVILLLSVVIVPVPPAVMDLLLSINIAIAAMVLLTTIFISKPLEFSVFPSMLLAMTLLRLVLNIATTRLILAADAATADEAMYVAGRVVMTFANIVTAGSLAVGIIIFLILIIVQFVVITKGATRISEVAARFTLDGMPGKQMAIDADLNAGLIDENTARNRREEITQEADFYGAMDGAAKFVRGDAIAGIIITIVNILGGIGIGMLGKGWGFGETVEVFTRLTIGDGLVSQVPAFIVSVAAALIVTRSSSRYDLGRELTDQLTSKLTVLWITAGFLVVMGVVGLPFAPMMILAVCVGGIALVITRQKKRTEAAAKAQKEEEESKPEPVKVEQAMHVDTLELEVGYGLVRLVDASSGGDLLDRITMIRRQLAADFGLVMPPVRIRDNMQLQPNDYHIKIRGNSVVQGQVYPGQFLAMDGGLASEPLPGVKTREPAFGLDAVWVEEGQKQRAEALGYTVVDAASVLATHLTEVVKSHASELLTREETNNLITQLKEKAAKLCDEVLGGETPLIKPGELQKVLQNLLRERVPIRDLESIVETLGDWGPRTKDLDVLTEYVRNGLRRTICSQYTVREPGGDPTDMSAAVPEVNRLYCVSLDPALEDQINSYIERSAEGSSLSMPPGVANRITAAILQELNRLVQAGRHPVVLASPQVRAQVRRLLEPHLPGAAVLGYNEVSKGVEVESIGLAQLQDDAANHSQGNGSAARGEAFVGVS
jgi:flagellar biosynthesis protein FlhA